MTAWQKFVGIFQPSAGARRAWRKMQDRWQGRFYEGAEPPPRLRDSVRMFRLLYPDATPDQWVEFAVRSSENAYRDGFTRGFQWYERDWDAQQDTDAPDRIAEEMAHSWGLGPRYEELMSRGYDPTNPLSRATPEQRRAFLEQMALVNGSPYRAVIQFPDDDD